LRKIAGFFDDKIKEGAERVIAKYQPLMDAVIAKYRPRLEGKTVMLFVGGLRPRHVIGAYEDLGMEVSARLRVRSQRRLPAHGQHYVKDGTLIYDDVTGYEFENSSRKSSRISSARASKENTCSRRWVVPFRQMHSWDYSGPYHGLWTVSPFFARDMDMAINAPIWKMAKAPWKTVPKPSLMAAE